LDLEIFNLKSQLDMLHFKIISQDFNLLIIEYSLPETSDIIFELIDFDNELKYVCKLGTYTNGFGILNINVPHFESGEYFLVLKAGDSLVKRRIKF